MATRSTAAPPEPATAPTANRWPTTAPAVPRAKFGYAYLHNAVDDHSLLAYTEILRDERQDTAVAFWTRAAAWFAAMGIDRIKRVLTDNGSCCRSHAWCAAVAAIQKLYATDRLDVNQTNGSLDVECTLGSAYQ